MMSTIWPITNQLRAEKSGIYFGDFGYFGCFGFFWFFWLSKSDATDNGRWNISKKNILYFDGVELTKVEFIPGKWNRFPNIRLRNVNCVFGQRENQD